jgi:hypothetical protein
VWLVVKSPPVNVVVAVSVPNASAVYVVPPNAASISKCLTDITVCGVSVNVSPTVSLCEYLFVVVLIFV